MSPRRAVQVPWNTLNTQSRRNQDPAPVRADDLARLHLVAGRPGALVAHRYLGAGASCCGVPTIDGRLASTDELRRRGPAEVEWCVHPSCFYGLRCATRTCRLPSGDQRYCAVCAADVQFGRAA